MGVEVIDLIEWGDGSTERFGHLPKKYGRIGFIIAPKPMLSTEPNALLYAYRIANGGATAWQSVTGYETLKEAQDAAQTHFETVKETLITNAVQGDD